MIDSFVLLAPILMLPVVGLVAFVGCEFHVGIGNPTPTGPTNLVATPGNRKVLLTWDAVATATLYRVKRGLTSGVHPTTFDVPATTTTFTDTGLTNGTTYFYVVSAVEGVDEPESAEVPATPDASSLISFVTNVMPMTTVGTASGQFGMVVQVGATDVDVQTLGRGFVPGNSQIHVVKIVDASGADVPNASAIVNMIGGVTGEFRYASLVPPVTLLANTKYYIVSEEISGSDQFYNHDMIIQTTGVASVPNSARGGPPYVEDGVAMVSYGPVNFQY